MRPLFALRRFDDVVEKIIQYVRRLIHIYVEHASNDHDSVHARLQAGQSIASHARALSN
jgi:hypothetical protein